jgi:hypothetical protein
VPRGNGRGLLVSLTSPAGESSHFHAIFSGEPVETESAWLKLTNPQANPAH